MKKIGQGWQYTVYDLGNGRVLKKQNTRIQTFWQIFFYTYKIKRSYKEYGRMMKLAQDSISFLKMSTIPKHLLGNPVFYNDNSYEQDKVIPINKFFKNHTLDQNKAVVDDYIQLCFTFWQYGFGDIPFKISQNYGVNKNGNVIIIDIGELYFDKEKAIKRINLRHWYKTIISDEEIRSYYRQKMDELFTVENLEKHWGIS